MRGPYRDHGPLLCSRIGEIDPLPVTDEHGADWLIWKQDGNSRGRPTPILAAPLAPGGLSLAGLPRELFRADAPWERGLVEGPALLRHDGMFYLVYSAGRCCGRHCNYATGVARSRSLLGPWEKRPGPFLEDGRRLPLPGPRGRGARPGRRPLLAYHAYARGDPANRQFLIAPLGFDAEGWPRSARPRPRGRRRPGAFEFGARELGQGWQWPVGPRPPARARRAERLASAAACSPRQAGTGTFSARTVVAGAHARRAARAGGDGVRRRSDRSGAARRAGGGVAADDGRLTGSARGRVGRPGAVELRVSVGRSIRMAVRARARLAPRSAPEQPPPRWTSGPRVALRVSGPAGARAAFDRLWIDPR